MVPSDEQWGQMVKKQKVFHISAHKRGFPETVLDEFPKIVKAFPGF